MLQWRNACFDPAGTIAKKGFNAGADSDFAWSTLAEELQLPANLCGYDPPGSDEMYKALETVRLDKPLNDWCDNFSGGEKQRVCLARLLLTKAETYLLDEPTAALDEETELDIFESLLQAAQRNGKTIV